MKNIDCQKIFRDLSRFEAELSAHSQVRPLAQAALRFAEEHLHLLYASLVLYDPEGKKLRLLATTGAEAFSSIPFRLGNKMSITALAIETCEMVYCRDVSKPESRSDALVRRLPKGVRSIAVLPLQSRESVLGTFNIGSPRVDGIAARHQAFFEAATPRLAASLRNAQVLEELTLARRSLQQQCDLKQSALSRSIAQLKQEVEERKRVEDLLKKSYGELEIEVAKRTAEIRKLQERLQAENIYLKEELAGANTYGDIIGESPALKEVISRIGLVAPTDANVLILGESGTGKELIARAIHRHSGRKEQPLIKVNCATIPKELYESEFFGHVKGAFTGAVSDRMGRFEAADGGTLFLDEVGEIPLSLQGKLLRVLQEGEFERVGEGRTRKVDVRTITATNKNLADEVRSGRFREDLYYRLNVFPIEITPLREHKEDIPLLAAHFTAEISRRLNRPAPPLTQANLIDLRAHDWPGNVRELQNVIERALILSPSGRLRFDLPRINAEVLSAGRNLSGGPGHPAAPILTEAEIKALQKQNLLTALIRSGWKIYGPNGAAQVLGIKPTTLIERMRSLRIKKPG
ncbi:MAG: sigma 54-interacting transcriptional regulator [Hyphomicrobiales bacterium]